MPCRAEPEHAAQADVVQLADQREHRAQHLQRHVIAQLVDDLVGRFGMRREAGFLALHVGDLVAQARRQVRQLFRTLDDIAALEAQQQTYVNTSSVCKRMLPVEGIDVIFIGPQILIS